MYSPANNDSKGTNEIFDMVGIMYLTALEMLHEIRSISIMSQLPDNIAILILIFLNFMLNTTIDSRMKCLSEIVRTTEAYGIVLTPSDKVGRFDHKELDIIRQLGKVTKKLPKVSWETEVC
jgi:hypothetical protein